MMKKIVLITIIICLILLMVSCDGEEERLLKESYHPIYTEPGGIQFSSPYPSDGPGFHFPSHTPEPTPTLIPIPSTLIASPTFIPVTPTPAPSNPTMYSSYAYMESYNTSTLIAEFDYFDLLQGEAAVDWLVESEGYSQDEAEAIVADWADSEFIARNLNPQLRTIDFSIVPPPLLMYYPSGAMVPGPDPVALTIEEVNMVYDYDPDLMLDSFFYYVEVNTSGEVVQVRQVYWP